MHQNMNQRLECTHRVNLSLLVFQGLLLSLICSMVGCDGASLSLSKARDLASVLGGGNRSKPRVLTVGDTVSNAVEMKLTVIPPSEFQMGSPMTEEKRSGDEHQHAVQLTGPILMGVYEVTQEEFRAVMGTLPEGVEEAKQVPVTNVSWEQAVSFCQKLSANPDEVAAGPCLPVARTEAEWEFACRGLTTTATHFGDSLTSMQANFDGNYPYESEMVGTFRGSPLPVGSFAPNALGLYDMHGNVWEWCSDWYAAGAYLDSSKEDPTGPVTGSSHVIRGGSWYNFGYACRSAYRSEYVPPLEANVYGFRVVASLGKDSFEMTELPVPAINLAVSAPATTPADSGMEEAMSSETTSPKARGMGERSTHAAATSMQAPILSLSETMVFFAAAGLLLLSMIDPLNLFSWRNADVALLFFAALALMMSGKIEGEGNSAIWVAFSTCALMRLIWGQRTKSLPRPVGLQLGVVWVLLALCLIVAVRAFMLSPLNDSTAKAFATESLMLVGIGLPLFQLASRHVETRFALGILLFWSILVPLIPIDDVTPWISIALILWGAVSISRPQLAGAAFAISLLFGMEALLLLPLWSTYYLGRPRRRFLMTTLVLGVTGVLGLKALVLAGFAQAAGNVPFPNFASSWFPASPAIALGATIIVAILAACPQRRRTEAELILRTTIVLMVVPCLEPNVSHAFISIPWILLTLLGGIGNRRQLIRTAGIYPALGRLVQRRVLTPQRATS